MVMRTVAAVVFISPKLIRYLKKKKKVCPAGLNNAWLLREEISWPDYNVFKKKSSQLGHIQDVFFLNVSLLIM